MTSELRLRSSQSKEQRQRDKDVTRLQFYTNCIERKLKRETLKQLRHDKDPFKTPDCCQKKLMIAKREKNWDLTRNELHVFLSYKGYRKRLHLVNGYSGTGKFRPLPLASRTCNATLWGNRTFFSTIRPEAKFYVKTDS